MNTSNHKFQSKSVKLFFHSLVFLAFGLGLLAPLANTSAQEALIVGNVGVTQNGNSVTVTWQTNRAATGILQYGFISDGYPYSLNANQLLTSQAVTINNVTANTKYFIKITARDSASVSATSPEYYFVVNQVSSTNINNSSSCTRVNSLLSTLNSTNSNLRNELLNYGFYGKYYNLPSTHPDMNVEYSKTWPKIGNENDWYSNQYFVFSRVDKSLNFGDKFFPIDKTLAGDPFHFAVSWRAAIYVPTTGNYNYGITSDDDSWVFIDNNLTSNLGGVRPAVTQKKSIYLTAGYHELEIFYAERRKYTAVMSFTADSAMQFYPLPDNWEVSDYAFYRENYTTCSNGNNNGTTNTYGNNLTVYNNGNTNTNTNVNTNNNNGQVLGDSYKLVADSNTNSVYIDGLYDPKYTRIVALYKTTDSPDVWAILANGQRHYITSPAAFNKYRLNWKKIQTVSRQELEKYPSARLVKAPENPSIYYLYQKPNVKWMKINFPTATSFISYQGNYWGNVVTIDQMELNQYPDVRLIKTAGNPNIYYLNGNTKSLIPSEQVFSQHQFHWPEVVEINQVHMDSYGNGAVLN